MQHFYHLLRDLLYHVPMLAVKRNIPTALSSPDSAALRERTSRTEELKMVASGVRELFDGDVAELLPYLRQGKLGFADINELLGRQFDRLSETEQQVMNWLAVNREPVSLPELLGKHKFVSSYSQSSTNCCYL